MFSLRNYVFTIMTIVMFLRCVSALNTNELDAQKFAETFDTEGNEIFKEVIAAWWEHATNMTDYNQKLIGEMTNRMTIWQRKMNKIALSYDYKNFQNKTLSRAFSKIVLGTEAMKNPKNAVEFSDLEATMTGMYSKAKVCRQNKGKEECLSVTPGLRDIMTSSRNVEELKWAWTGWRNASGRLLKKYYPRYAELINIQASDNGFTDPVTWILNTYEWADMESGLEALWNEVKPLYQQLHAYVRRRLQQKYKLDWKDGQIYADLLGNMWAQDWTGIYDLVRPYPENGNQNLDERLKELKYTPEKMVKEAERFFVSLGFRKLPETFWTKSLFTKPDDREVVCHASAWEMSDGDDVRLKMCITVTWSDFRTIHHELGHTYYQLGYAKQPVYFRESATPAFHEAIGDAIALSVTAPKHMKKLNLTESYDTANTNETVNFLLHSALAQVSFLPFGYIVDKWRWGVYRGNTPQKKYNEDWWKLRCSYQGVRPPVPRTEEDFDPGSKYHVASGTGYIRYFLSHLLHYELYKAMCKEANHTGLLHTCDFDGSKKAGNLLSRVLDAGTSKPWREIMKLINGKGTHSTEAILEYYRPLYEWLKKENEGKDIGWDNECPKGDVSSSAGGKHSLVLFPFLLIYLYFW